MEGMSIHTRVKVPFRVFHLVLSPLEDSQFLSYFVANDATEEALKYQMNKS